MKNTIRHRILSAVLACALSCTICAEPVKALAEELAVPAIDFDERELIDVIVKLKGDAVLASPEASDQGSDYIDTAEGKGTEKKLITAQNKVEDHIRRLYPKLQIKHRFTLTANAFSCTVPESIISDIEKDPLVENVSEVKNDIKFEPQLYTAKELGGINAFCNNTGCTGEGEVIAVIDTEFDVTHDMFAPMTDKEVKITKENVSAISTKAGFSSKLSADKVYISNKIPFAYDYGDDTPYTLDFAENYHGTHVSGIAAGNRIKLGSNKEMSGVAPDAQLLMMKVSNNSSGSNTITDENTAAAIEDAVKLKADVINMSFGRVYDYYDSIFYADSIKAAVNAGITLCASAGNNANDYLGFGTSITVENVDTGNISEPSGFPQVFSVASADNITGTTSKLIAGQLEMSYCECGPKYCSETFSDKEYPIVILSSGELEQATSDQINGKIVVFSGFQKDYPLLEEKCSEYGAAGIVVSDDSRIGKREDFLYTTQFALAVISRLDFSYLRESGAETISFVSEKMPASPKQQISYFSSYGVNKDLDLKPEIMGIGGNVLSADYNNKTAIKSGTSMASPYIAGCAALCDEYMKKQGIELAGAEKPQRIKNLLMNSAVPFSEDGILMSPRRQGAGLAALDRITDDKVIMTGESGKAAVELRDELGESFSFTLDITNISGEDIKFSGSDIALTTDGHEADNNTGKVYIAGQEKLSSTNDLPEEITVPAGKTITKEITIDIDPQQIAALDEVFTNGFFIEGFISLSGAENCCDISIPLIGFRGDWLMVPTINNDRYPLTPNVNIGRKDIRTDISFAKTAALFKDFVKNDNFLLSLSSSMSAHYPDNIEWMLDLEQKEKFHALKEDISYLSPNNDGFGDYFGCYYVPVREAQFTDINMSDSTGEHSFMSNANYKNIYESNLALLPYSSYSWPDGRYQCNIYSYVECKSKCMETQIYPFELCIDTIAPEVEYSISEENGKKLLKMTAKDDSLDGIYVMGLKVGDETTESRASFNALALTQRTLSHKDTLESNEGISYIYNTQEPESPLSDIQAVLTGAVKPQEYYNFCDIIPAEPDENGSFSFTYDLTELSEYSVCVLDRAFNEFDFHSEPEKPGNFKKGIWKCKADRYDKFYEFDDNNIVRYTDTSRFEVYNASYTIEDSRFILVHNNYPTQFKALIKWIDNENVILQWENDDRIEHLKFVQEGSIMDYDFFGNDELAELAKAYCTGTRGIMPDEPTVTYSSAYDCIVINVWRMVDDLYENIDVYYVDRETATGKNKDDKDIDLKDYSQFQSDTLWSAHTPTENYGKPRYIVFEEVSDNSARGTYAYQSDGVTHNFDCTFEGNSVTFSFDSYNDTGMPSREAKIKRISATKAELLWDNGFVEELTLKRDLGIIEEIGFMTDEQLIDLARDYYSAMTNTVPDDIRVVYSGANGLADILIFKTNEFGEKIVSEEFVVDVVTGIGSTGSGKNIDLKLGYHNENILGDVNGDMKVDSRDASLILGYYSNVSTGSDGGFTNSQESNADVNSDSKIDSKDASAILAYYSFISTGGTVSDIRAYLSTTKS